MAKGFSIKDKDLGYKKFMKATRHLAAEKPFVKAGILESAGKHQDSDLTVAAVATFHEFGTERIPERSVFRVMQATKAREIRDFIADLKDSPILNPPKALTLIGLKLVSLLKQGYQNVESPPLSPRTIAEKGSSKPLIDTGQLRNSVQYEVKKGGSE